MTQNELYNQLYNLREKLKRQFTSGGRAPTICTDEALQEMTAHPPRFKSDLVNISGLGNTFVDKYGDYFMPVFENFYKNHRKTTKLTPSVQDTLKSLENRLVNISRKNRLLYMGKISTRNAFDIYTNDIDYNNKVLDLILGKVSQITLCEMSLKENWEKDDKRFKKALQLIREITKDQRESGQYDLFIGYPYVVGKTFGEDFNIRAPLALFPVTFEKKPDKITIKLDKTKDIMFNNNLILTQNKFLGRADDIPEIIWEDFDRNTFLESLLAYYKQYNINIGGSLDALEKFEDISVKDFPDYRNGEFYLANHAILGKFSPYSSSIQQDFRRL
ncbi:MAG: HRDC domain-containing protein, partial [Christensenellales bacterium]